MNNLTSALGSNATTYEAIALKIVSLIEATKVPVEVGVIALKTAQLIFEARERDAWDLAWANLEKISLPSNYGSETSQEPQHDSQA